MKLKIAAVVLGAVWMAGCAKPVLSLHPLYTDSDRAFDQALVGTWSDEEGKDLLSVRPSGQVGYEAVFVDDSPQKQSFQVRLVPLGAFKFVDITSPAQSDLSIPGHIFAKVRLEDGNLYFGLLGADWLKDASAPAHEQLGEDQLLLTAPTSELRKFVLRYAQEPKAWNETKLRRLR